MFKKETPEQYLLDTLERIQKLPISFYGVYVGMSMLEAVNRGYRQLEIVSKLFEPLLANDQSRLFLMSNKDFILIGTQVSLEAIEEVLYQIKSLFADDHLLARQKENAFQQIFFLDKDMDRFKRLIHQEAAVEVGPQDPNATPTSHVLDPEILETILGQIQHMDTIDFIRRQSALSLNQKQGNRILFHEYYTSILQIQQKLCPGCDLNTDKSLFNQLTETLDRRMLVALSHLKLNDYPPAISLNLNLSTIQTPLFDQVVQSWPTPVIVEFQLSDIFNDVKVYQRAYQKLVQNGHQVLIDGLSPVDLEYLDVPLLRPHYIKLFWSPKWMEPAAQNQIKAYLNNPHAPELILARCGAEDALAWGRKIGIHIFQGHFIDAVLGALTKNACTFGQECTLASCMACRRALSPRIRTQCVHLKHIDATPRIKVI